MSTCSLFRRRMLGALLAMSLFGSFSACQSNGQDGEGDEAVSADVKEIAADEALPAQPGPGHYRRWIKYDGRERFYDITVPSSYKPGSTVPLVLSFHGYMGNPVQQRKDTGMDEVAAKNGFIVVYPAGTSRFTPRRLLTWNVGRGKKVYAVVQNVDDVGFVKTLLKEVKSMFPVDEKRIYSTGFSQGAVFTYRLATEMGDTFAAIGTVGGVTLEPESKFLAGPKLPVINFQAVNDPVCAYQGGVNESAEDPTPRPSARQMIDMWNKRNGIENKPVETGTVGTADFEKFKSAKGQEVIFWSLRQGGHVWPGGKSSLPERMVGPMNSDINASKLMWDFFSQHAKP